MRTPLRHIVLRLLAPAAIAIAAAGVAALAPPAPAAAAGNGTFIVERTEKVTSIQDLQRASSQARADMARLKERLDGLSGRYDEARARLDDLNGELIRARLELERAEAALEAQRTLVGLRLAAMYKSGDTTVLDVLAGVSGFAELESGLSLLKRIAESDQAEQAKLESMTASTARLAAALDERRPRRSRSRARSTTSAPTCSVPSRSGARARGPHDAPRQAPSPPACRRSS